MNQQAQTPVAIHDRAAHDKDQPLFDDIRLLGRMLGDTLREQEGSCMFELIENVQQKIMIIHEVAAIGVIQ